MGHQHDLLLQSGDGGHHPPRVAQVEQRRRLVEDEPGGLQHHDPGQRHHLPLAAGELVHQPVLETFKAETRKRYRDAVLDLFPGQPAAFQTEPNVLADGRVDDLIVGILEQEADAAPHFAVRRADPVDRHLARHGLKQAVEKPGEGALAGTVRPDDADPVLRQRQVDVGEHPAAAAIDRYAVEDDHRRLARFRPTARPSARRSAGRRASRRRSPRRRRRP